MLQDNYKTWTAFTFKGKKFLVLDNGRKVHVYGENFTNYGAYVTLDNFKKMYAEQGEGLLLA